MNLAFSTSSENVRAALDGIAMEAIVVDQAGTKWSVRLNGNKSTDVLIINVSDVPMWEIFIEGFRVGATQAPNPLDAVREVFIRSGHAALPEGIEIKAVCGDEALIIFTMDGVASMMTTPEFVSTVAKSTRWTYLRAGKRHEIDALVETLKREHAAR